MRRLTPFAAFATAACVAPQTAPIPETPPAPAPPLAVPPPAPAPVAWQDGPQAAGAWRWTADARGSVAMFGVVGKDADFVVRCDLAPRRVSLTVPGDAAAGTTLTIRTSDGERRFAATATGTQPPYAGAALPAADGFLDRIAFSRGRFQVQLSGHPAIVIPAWPEFARTIEDCRG